LPWFLLNVLVFLSKFRLFSGRCGSGRTKFFDFSNHTSTFPFNSVNHTIFDITFTLFDVGTDFGTNKGRAQFTVHPFQFVQFTLDTNGVCIVFDSDGGSKQFNDFFGMYFDLTHWARFVIGDPFGQAPFAVDVATRQSADSMVVFGIVFTITDATGDGGFWYGGGRGGGGAARAFGHDCVNKIGRLQMLRHFLGLSTLLFHVSNTHRRLTKWGGFEG
jgi:hypothetical protein